MLFFLKLNNRYGGKMLTVTSMKTQISLEGLHTMMKRKVLWALLAAGMAVVSTGVASAQSTTALPTVGLLGVLTKKSLVGSWVETVTFDNGRPPLKSLVCCPRNNISYKRAVAASQALLILRNTSVPLARHR